MTRRFWVAMAAAGLLSVSGAAYAGSEKEDLQLKAGVLQERAGRLQAEFEITRRDLVSIQAQLQEIEKKDAAKAVKKEDKK